MSIKKQVSAAVADAMADGVAFGIGNQPRTVADVANEADIHIIFDKFQAEFEFEVDINSKSQFAFPIFPGNGVPVGGFKV